MRQYGDNPRRSDPGLMPMPLYIGGSRAEVRQLHSNLLYAEQAFTSTPPFSGGAATLSAKAWTID
jgi:hypothetical protein